MPRKPSYVGNYIPSYIRKGYTATEALTELRGNGMSVATQTFHRLWGETQNQLAQRETMVELPLNRRPTPDFIGTATRPRARGYLYNVEVAVHDPLTGEVSFHAWGVRSQKLISIGNALQQAVESWYNSQSRGRNTPEGRAMGGMVTSVLHLVGEGE